MILPSQVIDALKSAIIAIDADIEVRKVRSEGIKDLLLLRKETSQILEGKQARYSDELGHMIIDSMDWDQPCLKAFNKARTLVQQLFKKRNK